MNAARLGKLQITLTTPVVLDAYEVRGDNILPLSSGFITFPKGTVFSRLRNEGGYISGISTEIAGKRYYVYSIPRAEHWIVGQRNDQQFVGYFHGGKNTRKTKRNRKTTRRNKSTN
jgi:hypothetical protein